MKHIGKIITISMGVLIGFNLLSLTSHEEHKTKQAEEDLYHIYFNQGAYLGSYICITNERAGNHLITNIADVAWQIKTNYHP